MRDTSARRRSPTSRCSVTAVCLAAAMALLPTGTRSTEPPDAAASGGGPPATMVVLEEQWEVAGLDVGQPPTIAEETVVGTRTGIVHGVDASSGKLMWQLEAAADTPLTFYAEADRELLLVVRQPEGSPTAELAAYALQGRAPVERWTHTFDLDGGLPYGHPRVTDDGTVVVSLYRAADPAAPRASRGRRTGSPCSAPRTGRSCGTSSRPTAGRSGPASYPRRWTRTSAARARRGGSPDAMRGPGRSAGSSPGSRRPATAARWSGMGPPSSTASRPTASSRSTPGRESAAGASTCHASGRWP